MNVNRTIIQIDKTKLFVYIVIKTSFVILIIQ